MISQQATRLVLVFAFTITFATISSEAASTLTCSAGSVLTFASSGAACIRCPVGSFAPANSTGTCDDFVCQPGTADLDRDPSTPCVSCASLRTYASQANSTSCQNVTHCSFGQEEVSAPTSVTDRVCRVCQLGFFKSQAGELVSCAPVTICDATTEVEAHPPTSSSDRVCRQLSGLVSI